MRAGLRLAILVNEFGELPIDADLIEARDDDVISLSGGCVCCSYGNDLMMAMMDMFAMDPRPDHIILEASGVALPGAIASSLSLLSDCAIDGVVVLADAETIQQRARDKYMSDTILRQLDDADIVLLNKTDLVSPEKLAETRDWLSAATHHAAVVETQRCTVSPMVVLQGFERQIASDPHHHSHDAGEFVTDLIVPDRPVNAEAFARNLLAQNPDLVRAKGFVTAQDGAMQTIQIVGERLEITPAPTDVETGVVTICLSPYRRT